MVYWQKEETVGPLDSITNSMSTQLHFDYDFFKHRAERWGVICIDNSSNLSLIKIQKHIRDNFLGLYDSYYSL